MIETKMDTLGSAAAGVRPMLEGAAPARGASGFGA